MILRESIARLLLGFLLVLICSMQLQMDHYVFDGDAAGIEVVDGEPDETDESNEADETEEDWLLTENSIHFDAETLEERHCSFMLTITTSFHSEIQIPPPECSLA